MPRLLAPALLLCPLFLLATAAAPARADEAASDDKPHVVFLTGDEEYRSEESMPMLAKILQRNYGFDVSVAYSLNDQGEIDPDAVDNITGIEKLDDADLMVLFTRFRDLPDDQFQHFLDYVESGKPIVAFRTATHAFKFDTHPHHSEWGWHGEKIAQLLGQNWITHHGHFGDGHERLTEVTLVEDKDHPILRGVEPYAAYSWLYHVQGGGDELRGDSQPLLMGRALKSKHKQEGNADRYPLTNPVAWVKTYKGRTGRVFMLTTAHPYDFKEEAVRRVSVNAILWALGMEQQIPEDGANVEIVGEYDPNNSGFGGKYKKGLRPEDVNP